MSQAQPFFSVVIPTYNRASLIGETLQSFLGQTYTDFELIVVDDGSTDDTAAEVQAWIARDSRIRYFKKDNGERGAARNYGVAKASGQYVTFIDSDDIAYPHALQAAYDHLKIAGWPTCFALRYEIRDKETMREIIPPPNIRGGTANEALRKSNVMGCIGVFIRLEVARTLPFEEDRKFAGTEDWLLWLKLAARYPIIYNERISYCMYQHDDRSVMNFPEDKLKYRAEKLRHFLSQDEMSVKAYGIRGINKVYAHMLTYASLHLAMSRKKGRALHYLLLGVRQDVTELFTRRTLGILKTILFR